MTFNLCRAILSILRGDGLYSKKKKKKEEILCPQFIE